MWMILIGLIIGAVAGLFIPSGVPAALSPYLATIALVLLDGVLSGAENRMRGNFMPREFVESLVANGIFASALVFMGLRMGIDLQLAVCIALLLRVFTSFSRIRNLYLEQRDKNSGILLGKQQE